MALDPQLLAVAIEAALAAGQIQRQYFRHEFSIRKKGTIDLVTEADLAVERDIRERIAWHFPSHTVLGEEGAQSSPTSASPFRWIVDPIDGTTNFAHGLALFCVSIGLEIDGRVALGVIYEPIGNELFTAERGEGARLNGTRIHVTQESSLIDSLLVTGFPYTASDARREQLDIFEAFLARSRAVRRLGSAALDLANVAAGRFEGFWEQGLHPWDVAAGALLVEEAGGTVSGFGGEAFDVFVPEIVATNGAVHPRVLEVIGAIRRG